MTARDSDLSRRTLTVAALVFLLAVIATIALTPTPAGDPTPTPSGTTAPRSLP